MTLKYYLLFDDEQIGLDCMAAIKAITHRDWDTVRYNVYTNKWWTKDPEGQTPPRYFQSVWDVTHPYRQEIDEDTWFSNPNPEDPPEYP